MERELVSFAAVVLLGLGLGVLFDVYRMLHYLFRPRSAVVSLLDFLYTLLIIAASFVTLLLVNWAEFRLYICIGIVCGGALYFYWCSRLVYRLLRCFADRLLVAVRFCRRLAGRFKLFIKNRVAK